MKRLKDKVAIVTGASKGIGAAIAERLADEGATVVVNYSSSKSGADEVVSKIVKAGGRAEAIQADISKEQDVERLFAETQKKFGQLDILVNNAGVYAYAPIEQMTVESFNKQFNLNVLGVMLCCREAVKLFGAAGGAIVNIGSAVSTLAPINSTVYSASKGGVELITKVLSKELGPRKIRVNSVNPGAINTPGSTNLEGGGDFFETIQTITPLGRIGEPTDIAPAVAYLASDDASFVTGEIITVSGGIK